MENIATLNLDKICRVCLLESKQMYSIYSELYEDQSNIGATPCIYEMLTSISSMKVQADDGLPSLICTKCIRMAHSSFKFQKQCNHSQTILDAYLKQCPPPPPPKTVDNELNLEGINKSDLVQTDNDINPSDFLLVEEEDMANNVKDVVKVEEVIAEGGEDASEQDPLDVTTKEESTSREEKEGANVVKNYVCAVCEKSYKYSNSLRVHMRNHTEERPYSCKICGKSFTQYSSFMYHERSHTGEQPYSCKLCGKSYKQSGTLTAHMRVHTGQRPFLCSICGRGFRQAPDLRYHMRSHTKEKPYMCNVCGKTMSMQSHLVQHMRIHTGEKPYKCDVCEKAFPSSTRLKRHAIIHTSLKPYTCGVCSKAFNRMSSLKVHSKIHTDERAHVCPICGKAFIQAHALRTHLASHSSELKRAVN